VYWGGKVFLGLLVPEDNPFWTTEENEGAWKSFKKNLVYNKFQPSVNMLITDYPNIGASEVRAWCHEKKASDWQKFRSTENYNRLSYNSAFPWQADGKNGEVAMNYVVKNKAGEWEPLRLYTFKGFEHGVFKRDAILESNENVIFKLNDKTLPNGILRIDEINSPEDIEIRLGHYALPEKGTPIITKTLKIGKHTLYQIDNGEYVLALVSSGFEKTAFVTTENLHPESKKSTVINVSAVISGGKKQQLVSLMLWKKSGEKFNVSDLKSYQKALKNQ
jgi:hypothetical protein